jgi:hypothetical protein
MLLDRLTIYLKYLVPERERVMTTQNIPSLFVVIYALPSYPLYPATSDATHGRLAPTLYIIFEL